MAACNLTDLEAAAIANGFEALDDGTSEAIELQMLYQLSGASMTLPELNAAACANGFDCLSDGDAERLELQLWCEIIGGI